TPKLVVDHTFVLQDGHRVRAPCAAGVEANHLFVHQQPTILTPQPSGRWSPSRRALILELLSPPIPKQPVQINRRSPALRYELDVLRHGRQHQCLRMLRPPLAPGADDKGIDREPPPLERTLVSLSRRLLPQRP